MTAIQLASSVSAVDASASGAECAPFAVRDQDRGCLHSPPLPSRPQRSLPTDLYRSAPPRALAPVLTSSSCILHFYIPDDVDLPALQASGQLELTLVDHHQLAPSQSVLRPAVVEVVDHHQRHEPSLVGVSAVRHQLVGSGASLVAEAFRESGLGVEAETAQLLRATILLDTLNLSPQAQRARPLDAQMLHWLEAQLHAANQTFAAPSLLLKDVEESRSDISSLSPSQVLGKDVKFLRTDSACIGVPTIPVLLDEFVAHVAKSNRSLADALSVWAEEERLNAVVLIPAKGGTRQLLLYSPRPSLRLQLLKALTKAGLSFDLQLSRMTGEFPPDIAAFHQSDPTHTRKKILPALAAHFAAVS